MPRFWPGGDDATPFVEQNRNHQTNDRKQFAQLWDRRPIANHRDLFEAARGISRQISSTE
jgi:hypothetical protein